MAQNNHDSNRDTNNTNRDVNQETSRNTKDQKENRQNGGGQNKKSYGSTDKIDR